jgi:hypothetical protein
MDKLIKKDNALDISVSTNKIVQGLMVTLPEHKGMVENISKNLPEIKRATSLFGKTQSQFMDNQLTVTHLTPLRNLRQILAEMNKSIAAYREADIKSRKKMVEIDILKRDLLKEKDDLKAELISLDIEEKYNQLDSSRNYISGAIRKISNYTEQYNSIKKTHDITDFTEKDFEEEEESYHISKAFQQGICSARSHGGIVDEGNQIYFEQLGINGGMAQHLVSSYLIAEAKIMQKGDEPSYNAYLNFIKDMITKFKGCSLKSSSNKGMTGKPNEVSMLGKGDTSLIEDKN